MRSKPARGKRVSQRPNALRLGAGCGRGRSPDIPPAPDHALSHWEKENKDRQRKRENRNPRMHERSVVPARIGEDTSEVQLELRAEHNTHEHGRQWNSG